MTSRDDSGAGAPAAPLQLAVFADDELTTYPLPATGQVTIGRAEESDVRVDHPSVSRRHAVLHMGSPLRIEDLGSANGIFIRVPNESADPSKTHAMRQLSKQSAAIAIGDLVNVGSVSIVVRRPRRSASSAAPSTLPVVDDEFVLRDPAMLAVYDQARRVAQAPISVLILGETGVGKEVLVHAIHRASSRAKGPLLGLNCAALSESLLESELFGHEKGAFTGADQPRPGLLESADGGTVFLDEVGDMPMSVQVKLLRVLEERKVMRVGSRAARSVDLRVIAATNRDLEAAIERETFRQDLYFRLNGIALTIPPLRERPSEIEPLVRLFAHHACRQLDRGGPPEPSPELLEVLLAHRWPGNVRELRNVIERAVLMCDGGELLPEHLPTKMLAPPAKRPTDPPGAPVPAPGAPGDPIDRLRVEMEALERQRVIDALEKCAGNRTRAAEVLGMSRRTLVTRLQEYGIRRPPKPS